MNDPDSTEEAREPLPQSDAARLQPYDIPVEGSLGLLAVGYRGLLAWREKRAEAGEEAAAENQGG